MNKQNDQNYVSAMRILDELCVRHDVPCTEKIRELFWRGVLLGQNRANFAKAAPALVTEKDPHRPKAIFRHDAATQSLRASDPGKSGANNDLGDAVTFRL